MKLTGFLLVSFFAFMGCQSKATSVANTIEISMDFSTIALQLDNSIPENEYAERFHVFILNGDSLKSDQSPIVGSYVLNDNQLVFTPSYPFLKGKAYLARYTGGTTVIRKKFKVPSPQLEASTTVSNVYPSAEILPLNILKVYIAFSQPMAAGFAYDNVFIVNAKNDTLQDVFLELGEELWSSDMKRLTLLFDPGRIKQGLESFDELGYVFEEGEAYQLRINRQWTDANNYPLEGNHTKHFTIGSPITSKAGGFLIENLPINGSKTPLSIRFGKAHDYSLMQRTIAILNPQGEVMEGDIIVTEFETVWTFTSTASWASGTYSIRFENILEDISGNNLLNAFDVDNRQGKTDFSSEKYRISEFRIK